MSAYHSHRNDFWGNEIVSWYSAIFFLLQFFPLATRIFFPLQEKNSWAKEKILKLIKNVLNGQIMTIPDENISTTRRGNGLESFADIEEIEMD